MTNQHWNFILYSFYSIWYANTANLTECNRLLVCHLIGIWRAHTHITTPVLGIICFNELVCTIRELRILIQHFNVAWQVRKENRFVPFNIPLGYIAVCNVTGVRTCACKYIMLSCAFSQKIVISNNDDSIFISKEISLQTTST